MIILYILLGLLGVLVLLLAAACVNAARIKAPARPPAPPAEDAGKAAEYAGHLARMIQCQTVNDPALPEEQTHRQFVEFRALMRELYPRTHAALEAIDLHSDAQLLRWPGRDSARGAIVLMSHSDVVPAGGSWRHPPFSGEIAEGAVWGRGAMDTKGSLCAIFEAVEGLLGEGFVPPCDVYISSSNNEETMGDGAPRAVAALRQRGVRFDLVSDEGGAVVAAPLPGLEGLYAMLGIVEKGYANVKFTAKSKGGHASAPPKDNPMARLAAFMHHMDSKPPFKNKVSKPLWGMFSALAPHMAFPYRLLFGNLWLTAPLLAALLPAISAQAAAMLHTTCVFTMAEGGPAANVIPAEASVTANLRFIMHQPMEESLALVREVAARYDLETEVLYAHDCSPYVDTNDPNYRYMLDCVAKVFPEAAASPYIMVGGTDARSYAPYCPCTVRFAPTILNAQQLASAHGIDENLYVDALARAVRFYTVLLRDRG